MKLIFIWTFILFIQDAYSQIWDVGESTFDENSYAEYSYGNLPLIISAPHGGEKRPDEIPDRVCPLCVYVNDSYTQELANEIKEEIKDITNCHPHVILNRLHRSKLDANRDIIEAADHNPIAEEAYGFYHSSIDTAIHHIGKLYGRGLLIDLHGHGHDIQRLELGYLLSKNSLMLSNSDLDGGSIPKNSSINNLVEANNSNLPFSELLRGPKSFGSIFSDMNVDAVPSDQDEYPESDDPYFSGGYITRKYGLDNQDHMDAIQIECHQGVRFNPTTRKAFAKKVALTIVQYMELHYFEGNLCSPTSIENVKTDIINIYPNPSSAIVHIHTSRKVGRLTLHNTNGDVVKTHTFKDDFILNIENLLPGIYHAVLHFDNGTLVSKNIMKY